MKAAVLVTTLLILQRKDLMQLTSVKYYIQTVTINSGVHETRLDAFPVDELSNVTFKSSGAIASIGK